MMPGDGINELRGDTHSVRLLANTTFKRVAHSQLTTYLLHVDHPALVGEARPLSSAAFSPDGSGIVTAEFGRLIADETEKWGNVIRAHNIKAE